MIEGDLHTQEAVIAGQVSGAIIARERVELQATAVVTGDIHTPRIAIVEGRQGHRRGQNGRGGGAGRRGFPQELINQLSCGNQSFVAQSTVPLDLSVRLKWLMLSLLLALLGCASRQPQDGRTPGRPDHARLASPTRPGTPAPTHGLQRDPRLARPRRSATSRPGPRRSRTRRSGPTPPRATTWSSPTASSSRTRRSGSRRSTRSTVFIVTSGAPGARRNVAPLIFRLEEASYLAGMVAGRPHQEQRARLRGRDRAAADQGGLPGLGERGQGGQPEGPEPRDLPQQLRRRGGRAGGGAGADPGRARTCSTTTPTRRRWPVPGGEGEPGGLRLRRQRRPVRARAGAGGRQRRHRPAPRLPAGGPGGEGRHASRPRSRPSGWRAAWCATSRIPRSTAWSPPA